VREKRSWVRVQQLSEPLSLVAVSILFPSPSPSGSNRSETDVEELKSLLAARIALSVPMVNAYTNPVSTAPIFASHVLDVQEFPGHAHVGPPGINVEVKLIGVDDKTVEGGGDPMGGLLVNGPPVGGMVGDWVNGGVNAKAQTNGTFRVMRAA
jgi:long-chain acyl-CoA synthetase